MGHIFGSYHYLFLGDKGCGQQKSFIQWETVLGDSLVPPEKLHYERERRVGVSQPKKTD